MKAGKFTLNLDKPTIMGILNVTPDSFYDGGRYHSIDKAIDHGINLSKQGADIIDIGGESTRPGSLPVNPETELKRIIPIIERLHQMINVPISIDTNKPEVAEAALDAGASIINDITGLADDDMAYIAHKFDAPVVIMHMQGSPDNMQQKPKYSNVIQDISAFFRERIKKAQFNGIKKIILDPGIGFGKTIDHNLQIIQNLKTFKELGHPLLIGTSRKSFISKITCQENTLSGSISSAIYTLLNGANIVRVHDVMETHQAIQIMEAISNVTQSGI